MNSEVFGTLRNGERINSYTLSNNNGMTVKILNYGGIIQSIKVPCKEGDRELVLAYEHLSDYEDNPSYLGALIGRTAGRLDRGKLHLDGKTYDLNTIANEHLLHGGDNGFHQKMMEARLIKLPQSEQVRLRFQALSCEDDFPSNIDVEITYQLNRDENVLRIIMKGVSDEKTYMNLTNHSYFNLSDKHGDTIEKHQLELNANFYSPVDTRALPLDEWKSVEASDLDFRCKKTIDQALTSKMEQIKLCKGIDHPFAIERQNGLGGLTKAASLYSPTGDLKLEVSTTQKHLVVYSGNYLSAGQVESGQTFIDYQGICFETQEKPNLINTHPESCHITEPGNPYHEEVKYSFIVHNPVL